MSDEAITVYYNPRCSKSRRAAELLAAKGVEFSLFDYLEENPGVEELRGVMRCLGIDDPRAMMRTKEDVYGENDLENADAERLLAAMATHPILIERPIVIRGDRALIARPPERIEEIL